LPTFFLLAFFKVPWIRRAVCAAVRYLRKIRLQQVSAPSAFINSEWR